MQIPFLSVLLFLAPMYVSAQWESTHGPFGSYINDLGQNDHYVFAATTTGLFRSEDVGLTWKIKPFFEDARYPCLQFDIRDSLIIADAVEVRPGTKVRHMYKSIDEGESWIEIPRPPVQTSVDVAIVGTFIFAYDRENIWISENNGLTWYQSLINHDVRYPNGFNHYGDNVFVGDGDSLYIYSGDDTNWEKIKIPLAFEVASIYAFDSVLLVRDYDKQKLFVSEDFGITWFMSSEPQWGAFENYFTHIGDKIFATDYLTMYTSIDNGHTWEAMDSKGMDWSNSIMAVDSVLFSGIEYAGLFRSTDLGSSFHFASEGIEGAFVQSLHVYEGQLLTSGYLEGVFNYDPLLRQWHQTYFDEHARIHCLDLDSYNGQLYLAADGYIYRFDISTSDWVEDGPEYGFGTLFTDFYHSPYGLLASGHQEGYSGPLHVLNHFNEWTPFTINIEGEDFEALYYVQNDHYQFLARSFQLARSENGGADWSFLPEMLEPDMHLLSINVIDSTIFLIQSDDNTVHTRLMASRDNGNTWKMVDDGIPREGNYTGIRKVIEVGDYLLCSTLGSTSGIYFTRKDNFDWQPFNEGLPWLSVKDIVFDGEYLYAAFAGEGVWQRKAQELFLTSYKEPTPQVGIQIFPNPASESFYIQFQKVDVKNGTLRIVDLQGRLMMEKSNAELDEAINIFHIPDGMYVAEIQTTFGKYTTKLIIQH